MSKRTTTTVDLSNKEILTAGYLSTRFIIVDVIVKSKNGFETLQLVNCRAEIRATGTLGTGTGNPAVKNEITIYSSLNGYDESTSLLTKIKQAVDYSRSIKKDKINDLVSLTIRLGYMSLPRSTDYILVGDVFNLTSSRDEGKRTQAWKFEMNSADIYNNSFDPIFKKDSAIYKKGEVTYLKILKDIYTPNGESVSLLDQSFFEMQLDPELAKALDVKIISQYTVPYGNYASARNKKVPGDVFGSAVTDFWNSMKKKGYPLENKSITVRFTKPSGDLANKATLAFYDKEDAKMVECSYLDDSVISNVERTEAGIINVTTLFDPTVFLRDGIILKTRYFSSTTIPSDVSLISAGTDVIVDRYTTLKENVDKETPVWYIVTYELNFNNTSTAPCTTTLLLSRDYIPLKLL